MRMSEGMHKAHCISGEKYASLRTMGNSVIYKICSFTPFPVRKRKMNLFIKKNSKKNGRVRAFISIEYISYLSSDTKPTEVNGKCIQFTLNMLNDLLTK